MTYPIDAHRHRLALLDRSIARMRRRQRIEQALIVLWWAAWTAIIVWLMFGGG